MRPTTVLIPYASLATLIAAACGADGLTADELNARQQTNHGAGSGTSGMMTNAGGTGTAMPGVNPGPVTPAATGEQPSGMNSGVGGSSTAVPNTSATMPTGPEGTSTGGASPVDVAPEGQGTGSIDEPVPGAGGAPPVEETPGSGGGGNDPGPAGAGGAPSNEDGAGGAGGSGEQVMEEPEIEMGPYTPRTGPFNMLAYSRTAAFRHSDSINTGRQMLTEIAEEQGFTVTFTEENDEITAEGLANYEIVFFLNSTGDIFNNNEQQVYEDWMTSDFGGAFAGTHSATDTENGWAFYSEVTGQYYDLHDPCCAEAEIQWDPDALTHVTVQGLPNPWRRAEEWYLFNRAQEWSAKAGFQILSRVTTNNNTRPVSYVREWGNFRSFYTSLGHEGPTFQDDNVKRHVAAGIMWAVRREAELK